MSRKRTNYEKKGIVRQIAGSIFASQKVRTPDSKWRPRKTQFERLHGDDGEEDDELETTNFINRAFSIESELHEYKRDLLFEKKTQTFETLKKKRDLSSITIKPSLRDKHNSRTLSARNKRVRRNATKNVDNLFEQDPFNSKNIERSDESIDDTASRNTSTSKQTSSSHQTEFHTVKSDPSDYFSKQLKTLTKSNLDLITSTSAGRTSSQSSHGIENINRRGRFHQFTIDEDKESTVVDPVVYPGDETIVDSDDELLLDENSQYSFGYTSKGTLIQRRGPQAPTKKIANEFEAEYFTSMKESTNFDRTHDRFENSYSDEIDENNSKGDVFDVIRMGGVPDSTTNRRKPTSRDPSQQFQSTHSLAYSESSCEDVHDNKLADSNLAVGLAENASASNTYDERKRRNPLSPLNVIHQSTSRANCSSLKKEKRRLDTEPEPHTRPDPDASWSAFPCLPEKKPDPKGTNAKTLPTFIKDSHSCTPVQSDKSASNVGKRAAANMKTTGACGVASNQLPFINTESSLHNLEHQRTTEYCYQAENRASQQMSHRKENKATGKVSPTPNYQTMDEDDDIYDETLEYEYGYMKHRESDGNRIGIQSFPMDKNCVLYGSASSSDSSHFKSKSAHSRSLHDRSHASLCLHNHENLLKSNKRDKYRYDQVDDQETRSLNGRSHNPRYSRVELSEFQDEDAESYEEKSLERHSTCSVSFTKPLGVPNNAIMASMLFRRHHNIDTQIVEETLKAKELEYKKDKCRGDIPQSIQAMDGVSCVSSFSEDTAAQIAVWRKPTRDLLEHFSRSRKTEHDFKMHIQNQRAQATELFEA